MVAGGGARETGVEGEKWGHWPREEKEMHHNSVGVGKIEGGKGKIKEVEGVATDPKLE